MVRSGSIPSFRLLLLGSACLLSAPALAQLDLAPLRALLDGRPARLVARDRASGGKMFALDVDSGDLYPINEDLAVESPLIAPDGTRVVYQQSGSVFIAPFGGGERTLVGAGYDPHWWVDAAGDDWVYYATRGNDPNGQRICYYPNCLGIETRRIRLRDNLDEFVVAWKGNGGPSADGTHLGAGEATMIIFDLPGNQQHFVNEGYNACNPSLSPDNRYLLMHLTGTHQYFLFRDIHDNVVWQIKKPVDAEQWVDPEWSTDPDFATATAGESNGRASACVVKISTSEYLRVLDARSGLHDWSQPHLWVGPRREDGGAAADRRDAARRDLAGRFDHAPADRAALPDDRGQPDLDAGGAADNATLEGGADCNCRSAGAVGPRFAVGGALLLLWLNRRRQRPWRR